MDGCFRRSIGSEHLCWTGLGWAYVCTEFVVHVYSILFYSLICLSCHVLDRIGQVPKHVCAYYVRTMYNEGYAYPQQLYKSQEASVWVYIHAVYIAGQAEVSRLKSSRYQDPPHLILNES